MKICYCGPISLSVLSKIAGLDYRGEHAHEFPLGALTVKGYLDLGHAVHVVTTSPGLAEVRTYTNGSLSVTLCPKRRKYGFLADNFARERRHLKAGILSSGSDVVHSNWCYEYTHAALDAGLPLMTTIHDAPWVIARHLRTPYSLYKAIYGSFILKRCRHVSFVSPYIQEAVNRGHHLATVSQRVIPNGIDRGSLLRADSSARKTGKILCVAGADRRKNFDLVFRSFIELAPRVKDASLTVCGHGLDRQSRWAREADALGLAERIEWLGSVPHTRIMDDLLPSSHAFVTSTREESFCMAVLEAMAKRTPVVASATAGAVPWLLDQGACGVLVQGEDPQAWASALEHLLSDISLASRLGESGYRRAEAHFLLETVAGAYARALNEILETA